MKKYELSLKTLPSLDLKHHLNDLNELKDFLINFSIDIKNTRIERYIKYFQLILRDSEQEVQIEEIEKIFKHSPKNIFQHQIDYHLYILREVHELMWILKGLKVVSPLGIEKRLKTIISGKDFATLDSSTNSRNTQFELRIASYFCQFGCRVDLSTETDIIAYTQKQIYYIECKRVGNQNKLEERLSEARKQLQKRMPKKITNKDIYGCIAIDVTKVAFSHNGLTFAKTNEHSKDIIQDKLKEIRENIDIKMQNNFNNHKNLCQVWLQIHIPSLIQYPQMTATRFSSYHCTRDYLKLKQNRGFKVFKNIFETASLSGDIRENEEEKLEFKNSFTLPKGTLISLDEDLLKEYARTGNIKSKINHDKIIGSIEVETTLYEFHFFELISIIKEITKKEFTSFDNELDTIRVTLLAKMYLARYPYKE